MEDGPANVLECLSNRSLELSDISTVDKENRYFIDDDDMEDFVIKMRNPNTVRKTTGDVKLFTTYLQSTGEKRSIKEILPNELDNYLARFFLNVRKADKSEYEPDTLKIYQSSISRYLSEKHYCVNILTDVRFQHSRDER